MAPMSWWTPIGLVPGASSLASRYVSDGAVLLGVDGNPHTGYAAVVVRRVTHDPVQSCEQTMPVRLTGSDANELLSLLRARS